MIIPVSPLSKFNESSEIIALISHPGWEGFKRQQDEIYEQLRYERENFGEYLDLPMGDRYIGFRAGMRLCDSPLGYKHQLLEADFIEFLQENEIPVIYTLPLIEPELQALPFLDSIFSNIMSSRFMEYLNHISSERSYYVPTFVCQDGFCYGDVVKYNKEMREICQNKKILIAGANLEECLLGTVMEICSDPNKLIFLTQYCRAVMVTEPSIPTTQDDMDKMSDGIRIDPSINAEVSKNFKKWILPKSQSWKSTVVQYDGLVEDLNIENL